MPADRPNIVFIVTDQQRFDTIAALGFPYMDTPNLDRLCSEGVVFSNAYCTGATCICARASFFQGVYGHNNGVYTFQKWQHGWIRYLKDAGYYCANVGKMHYSPILAQGDFHERFVVENKNSRHFERTPPVLDEWDKFLMKNGTQRPIDYHTKYDNYEECLGAVEWHLPEDWHSDFFVGNEAVRWIEKWDKRAPLFLMIGFPGPHDPYDPVERYIEPYMERDLPPALGSLEELQTKPRAHKLFHDYWKNLDGERYEARVNLDIATPELIKRMRAHYYANVTMIDEKIGEIMDALKSTGILDNSIVLFTSDHGDNLGDHSLPYKWTMYDGVTKIPMVVFAPSRYAAGHVVDGLVQHFDVVPSLLAEAGIKPPDYLESIDITPSLKGEQQSLRKYVFCEQSKGAKTLTEPDVLTMMRSHDWKLVHYLGTEEGELYDLKNDPGELVNLYDAAEYREVREQMTGDFFRWQVRSNYEAREQFRDVR